MKSSLIFSLLMIVTAAASQAQNLKLMGKGLAKRGTNESIALACVTEECKQVQFAYFNGPGEPQWLGPKIAMPTAPSEELQEKALKTKLAYYMATNPRAQEEHKQAGKVRNTVSWVVMIGVGGAAVSAGPMALGAAVLYFAPIAAAGLLLRAFPPRSLDAFLVGSGDSVTISKSNDQSGWSWSSDPKVVSAKKFDRLIENLKSKTRYSVYGDGGELDHVTKKMGKLQDQGVDFHFMNRTGEL